MLGLSFKGKSACVMLALSFCLALASCTRKPPKSQIDATTYAKEIEQWHHERWKELNNESGWLTLIGLFWLKEGENKFGSDSDNDIILPKAKVAGQAGTFFLHNGIVRMDATQDGTTVDSKPIKSLDL